MWGIDIEHSGNAGVQSSGDPFVFYVLVDKPVKNPYTTSHAPQLVVNIIPAQEMVLNVGFAFSPPNRISLYGPNALDNVKRFFKDVPEYESVLIDVKGIFRVEDLKATDIKWWRL